MKTVGQTIRYWRKKSNLSGAELGRRVGIDNHRLISMYENDRKNVNLCRLIQMAHILNAPKDEFITAYFRKNLQKFDLHNKFNITVTER